MHNNQDAFTRWGERYEGCLSVKLIQRALDPAPGDAAVFPKGNNKWSDTAFQKFCEASDNLPLNRHLRSSRCEPNAEFALGLDTKRVRKAQILASVARAYAWTEAYGAAYLDERERVFEIRDACDEIQRGLAVLAGGKRNLPKVSDKAPHQWTQKGPIYKAWNAHAGLRVPSTAMFLGKRSQLDDLLMPADIGLDALWAMYRALHRRRANMPNRFAADQLRRFFVICLMEIFIAFTGELPAFEIRKVNEVDRAWTDFLRAALSFFGFKSSGLRDVLRSLKSGGHRADKKPDNSDNAEDGLNIPLRLVEDLEEFRKLIAAYDGKPPARLDADVFPSAVLMWEVASVGRPADHESAYARPYWRAR
jgi:hypothetical protein